MVAYDFNDFVGAQCIVPSLSLYYFRLLWARCIVPLHIIHYCFLNTIRNTILNLSFLFFLFFTRFEIRVQAPNFYFINLQPPLSLPHLILDTRYCFCTLHLFPSLSLPHYILDIILNLSFLFLFLDSILNTIYSILFYIILTTRPKINPNSIPIRKTVVKSLALVTSLTPLILIKVKVTRYAIPFIVIKKGQTITLATIGPI